jgi:hypothetical protein
MRYADFVAMVEAMRSEVEPQFLDGVDAIEVTRSTIPHPVHEDVYTLGECVPRGFGPDDEGPRLHSRILLHHGSFAALARITEGFDWRHEAWETLTHELRHHLEWRARVPALEALDEAVDANYARHDGLPFPVLFYLSGESAGPGIFKVEDDLFFDRALSPREIRGVGGKGYGVGWHGKNWEVQLPAELPDVLFLTLDGLKPEPAGEVILVLRRRPGIRDLWHRTVVSHQSARVVRA